MTSNELDVQNKWEENTQHTVSRREKKKETVTGRGGGGQRRKTLLDVVEEADRAKCRRV